MQMILSVPSLLPRFSLVMKQLHASGVMTLSIILVSGLFVGMVLALQGYNTLIDFGAEESIGTVVALNLGTRTWPSCHRLAVCRTRRLGDDGGNWLDESN